MVSTVANVAVGVSIVLLVSLVFLTMIFQQAISFIDHLNMPSDIKEDVERILVYIYLMLVVVITSAAILSFLHSNRFYF